MATREKRLLLFTLFVFAMLAVGWGVWLQRTHETSFWHSHIVTDYTELSLSHGIVNELRFSGELERKLSYFEQMHPGIPFQIASWIAYRSSLPETETGDRLKQVEMVLNDPEPFWSANRSVAMIITAIGIVFAGMALYRTTNSLWAVWALPAFYGYQYSFHFTYYLGNELFALLVGTGACFLAWKALGSGAGRREAVAFGVVCAIGYLNKLNYVAYFPAFALGCLAMAFLKQVTVKECIHKCLFAGLGLFMGLVVFGISWLGWGGWKGMFELHYGVLTHSGYYGMGAPSIIGVDRFFEAIATFVTGEPYYAAFAVLILGLAVLVALGLLPREKRRDEDLPWIVYLISTALLCALAAFKHFQFHYLIAACVPITFLAGYIAARAQVPLRTVTLAAAYAILAVSVLRTATVFESLVKVAAEDEELNEAARRLPLEPGETRVWGFKINSQEYLTSFTATMVNSPKVTAIFQNRYPEERTTAPWLNWDSYDQVTQTPIEEAPWRYAILDESWLERFGYERFPFNEDNGRGRVVLSNSHVKVIEKVGQPAEVRQPAGAESSGRQ